MSIEASSVQSSREIFLAALKIADEQQRLAFLQQACGEDAERVREIERLLEANQAPAASPLERAVEQLDPGETRGIETEASDHVDIASHPTIDRYKLLEQIGEGGMGSVFMAQQTRPVKRKVALKLIKPGMDSREVIARFEAERQALAMMDHPNIARVLDAGTTAEGRPYFVMELVRGIPITDYCDHECLSIDDRLRLFIDVCRAVQHAHQKGIIHRDIKPSNVMITLHDGTPVVKVIDFGVAKALNQELTERTLFTQFAQMIGTPLYMSPEQAEMSGLNIDTRSDVYSLGVLLYELLTGSTPFDKETLTAKGYDEMRRIIREDEAPRPSHRISTLEAHLLSTVSGRRQIDPRHLSLTMRRELDWIAMKALEKDRSRRYESASALAQEVQRYLDDEPVEACPPSILYRLRKLSRRHRRAIGTAAVVLLLIVAGLSAGGVLVLQEQQLTAEALDAAEEQREAAEQAADREVAQRRIAEADYLLARQAVERMLTQVAEGPLATDFGFRESRRNLLQGAESLYSELLKNHPEDASLFIARAKVRELLGDYAAAIADGENAIKLSPNDVESLNWLGHTYAWAADQTLRDLDRAIGYFERAVALAPDHTLCRVALSAALDIANRSAEASQQIAEAKRRDPKNVLIPIARAQMHVRRGDYVSARAEAEAAIRLDPQFYKPYCELAGILLELGHHEAALAEMDKAIALEGQPGCNRAHALHQERGDVLVALGRDEEALAEFDRGIELAPYWSNTYMRRAAIRFRMGRYDEAIADLQRGLELFPDSTATLLWIPAADVRRCPSPAFRERLLQLADSATQRDGASAATWAARGRLRAELIGPAEGREDFARAIQEGDERLATYYYHAIACLSAGDGSAYRKACADMLERFRDTESAEAVSYAAWSIALAPEAVADFQPVIMLAQQAAETQPENADAVQNLGAVLYRAGRFAESAKRLEAADRMHTDSTVQVAYTRFLLAMAYYRMGDERTAQSWFDKAAEWTDATLADPQRQVDADISWNRRATLELLRAEAKELLDSSNAEPADAESQPVETSTGD